MNIAENLTRIEAAVNSLKTDVARLDGGNVSNINEAVEFIGTLKSEAITAPTFVEFDGSLNECIEIQSNHDSIEMALTDFSDGTLAISMNIFYGANPVITIVDGHLNYILYNSDFTDSVTLVDPELLDNKKHIWVFEQKYFMKDSSIVAQYDGDGFSTLGIEMFRSGVTINSPWTGKARIYSYTKFSDSAWSIPYYPKNYDSSTTARLICMKYYEGWNNPSVMNTIYHGVHNEETGASVQTISEYSKYRDEYSTSHLYIDASTVARTFDASNDGYYAYSSVTARPVDASIDTNIQAQNIKAGVMILGVEGSYEGGGGSGILQEKSYSIDLDTIDSSIVPDEGYDGLSSASIDSSTLNMQRTNILEHLLGIAGTSRVNAIVSESELQNILDRLLGIAGTSVVNAVIDDDEAQQF